MFSSSEEEEEEDDLFPEALQRLPRTFQDRRLLEIEGNVQHFRERFRVPKELAMQLIARLSDQLAHPTARNHALRPQEQVLTYLHYLGTSSFYHVMRSSHGMSSSTVCRIVRSVTDAILTLESEEIHFPSNPIATANDFKKIANFPSVVACLDGTHILVEPPAGDEGAYINRHHSKSLNVLLCCGADHKFFYVSSRCPGSWHDSRVLKDGTLWSTFETGFRPFPGAVILGDSAYCVTDWLIPPFKGDPEDPCKIRFNNSHKRTRSVIERAIGILKQRFTSLKSGLRVKKMELAAKIIKSAVIVHNMCISFGDNGEDFLNQYTDPPELQDEAQALVQEDRSTRRQQLLETFSRQRQ